MARQNEDSFWLQPAVCVFKKDDFESLAVLLQGRTADSARVRTLIQRGQRPVIAPAMVCFSLLAFSCSDFDRRSSWEMGRGLNCGRQKLGRYNVSARRWGRFMSGFKSSNCVVVLSIRVVLIAGEFVIMALAVLVKTCRSAPNGKVSVSQWMVLPSPLPITAVDLRSER